MDDIEFKVRGKPYTSNVEQFVPNNPLNRPKIKYKKFIFSILGFFIILISIYIFSHLYLSEKIDNYNWIYTFIIILCIEAIYVAFLAKKAVIWCVKVYQHYAPDHVRLRCVFEPSCSEYMILAVEKYGVIKGVIKGIGRLLRCHLPGGIDYP